MCSMLWDILDRGRFNEASAMLQRRVVEPCYIAAEQVWESIYISAWQAGMKAEFTFREPHTRTGVRLLWQLLRRGQRRGSLPHLRKAVGLIPPDSPRPPWNAFNETAGLIV